MTVIQPSVKFGAFLSKCGLPAAMAVCQGELCEDYLESALLRDCLEIYRTLNSKHEIMPVLERIIQSKCQTFADWHLVYDASATKNLHQVALTKMCELAETPAEYNDLIPKIQHFGREFADQIFSRFLTAANSFSWLSHLYYNYVRSNVYQFYSFEQDILLKMFNFAQTATEWQKLYYLCDEDFPPDPLAQMEEKLINLSADYDFNQMLSLSHSAKTPKLQNFVLPKLIKLGTFQDWADSFGQFNSTTISSFNRSRESQLLRLANTLYDWLFVYLKISGQRDYARLKLLGLAQTFADWQYLLQNYFKGHNSDAEFEQSILKNLCQQAQSWEEWTYVLKKTEYKTEYHDQVLAALLAIDDRLDQWKDLIKWAAGLYNAELQQKIITIARQQLQI